MLEAPQGGATTQVNLSTIKRALYAPGLSSSERVLLAALADRANEATRVARPSRQRLVRETGISAKHIQRMLVRLESIGYLKRTGRAAPGKVLEVTLNPAAWPRPDDGERAPPAGTQPPLFEPAAINP